jgi:hypothetical protein
MSKEKGARKRKEKGERNNVQKKERNKELGARSKEKSMEQGASSGAKSQSKDKDKVAWSQEQERREGAISGATSKRKAQGIRKRIKSNSYRSKKQKQKAETLKMQKLFYQSFHSFALINANSSVRLIQ